MLTCAGDMNKPIYRYLAKRKWEEYKRKIQVQRIEQMKVDPDVLPNIPMDVDIDISFGSKKVHSGDFVASVTSESPFRLKVQSFDKGEKLVTVAVVDPDVPNVETDSFDSRCHFLASNIPISHINTSIDLAKLSTESQVILPYLPAYAQRGAPYHRLAIVIFHQKDNTPVDLEVATSKAFRDNFALRAFVSRHMLKPIGASLFRTKWDEDTAGVMSRVGVDGADVELKRTKVEPLPYKRRNPATFR
jgi:large subunit ribosomal protein L35